jgi:hypothetical protein
LLSHDQIHQAVAPACTSLNSTPPCPYSRDPPVLLPSPHHQSASRSPFLRFLMLLNGSSHTPKCDPSPLVPISANPSLLLVFISRFSNDEQDKYFFCQNRLKIMEILIPTSSVNWAQDLFL